MTEVETQMPSSPQQDEAVAKPRGQRTCLLVLGMHRSGTSALTRMLSLAGAALPERLMPAGPGNESGHWEPLYIVEYHDKVLESIGSSWHDWRAADFSNLSPQQIRSIKEKLWELIEEDYPEGDLYVIKDPRICRFAKFFIEMIEERGDKVALIHTFRNPLDVVNSLNKRQGVWPPGYTTSDAALLWLRHVLDVEKDCRGRDRALVSFDLLMSDPRKTLEIIAQQTGLVFENSWEQIEAEVATFLSPNQRHHSFNEKDLQLNPDTRGWAERTFLALRELEKDHADPRALAEIEDVTARLNEASALFERAITGARAAMKEFYAAKAVEIARLTVSLEEEKGRRRNEQAASEADVATLQAKLAEAEGLRTALTEAFQEEQRRGEEQRLDLLQLVRKVELERDLRLQEILLLQRQLSDTHRAYTGSTSWRVTRPIRLFGRSRSAMKEAVRAIPGALGIGAGPSATTGALNVPADAEEARKTDRIYIPAYTLFAPMVTVVVPSPAEGADLKRRLNTIYAQDYKNIEVILLNDRTVADTTNVLRTYRDRYASTTTLLESTGKPNTKFRQWQQALSIAKGDLVWFADCDDWNEPNFLSKLVPSFRDESVMLAYANSIFMNEEGSRAEISTADYLSDLDPDLWRDDFTLTAHKLASRYWWAKDIIVSYGSALVRRPVGPYQSGVSIPWHKMAHCGDWLFFLNAVRGGRIHFSSRVNNYSAARNRPDINRAMYAGDAYYLEREAVAEFCQEAYRPESGFASVLANKLRDLRAQNPSPSGEPGVPLEQLFSLQHVNQRAAARKPSILMAAATFSTAGSDSFAIMLANLMRREGHSVTFLNCNLEPMQEEVRRLLRNDIPVVTGLGTLAQTVGDYGIDVVHSHNPAVDQKIMEALPANASTKAAVTLHGLHETLGDRERQKLIKALEKRADAIVYPAAKNLAPFRELGLQDSPKLTYIANALEDTPYEAVQRVKLNLPENAFVLCLVSRAIPQKGWAEAIEAVKIARERTNIDIRLLLIGTGPEEQRLRAAYGQSDFVSFLGFRRNVRDFYAASDMGLLPSRFPGESYPLSIIDCLATGRPMLASAIGEIPQMLTTDGQVAGCLFELSDWTIPIETLANRIILCAGDKTYYAQMRSLTGSAHAKFDPRRMIEQYSSVYQSLIGTAGESGALAGNGTKL